jgi:uncharacterized protein (TIGR03435 family)
MSAGMRLIIRYAEKSSSMLKFLCGLALGAVAMLGQAPPGPTFDVATIKAAGPLQAQVAAGKLHVGMTVDAAMVNIGFMSLADLIPVAFAVKPYQVSGPNWMKENRFDILAKIPEGVTKDQVPRMLQALLTERFKMVAHRESKEEPIYALVVGKGGPKLKESAPDADAPPVEASPQAKNGGAPILNMPEGQVRIAGDGKGAVVSGGAIGPTRVSTGPNGTMHLESAKITLPAFADLLTRFMDRPVIDMTEIKGTYEIGLNLSMIDLINVARSSGLVPAGAGIGGRDGAAVAASDPGGGSIFDAVQSLGLKLEPRKSSVDTIVIDHLEKMPTDN